MVGEFPELQGLMGGKYLLEEGETRVWLKPWLRLLPNGAGDVLPQAMRELWWLSLSVSSCC